MTQNTVPEPDRLTESELIRVLTTADELTDLARRVTETWMSGGINVRLRLAISAERAATIATELRLLADGSSNRS